MLDAASQSMQHLARAHQASGDVLLCWQPRVEYPLNSASSGGRAGGLTLQHHVDGQLGPDARAVFSGSNNSVKPSLLQQGQGRGEVVALG
jgi:hypothetical protein